MILQRTRYLERIRKYYESNLIKVLTGVRRCGKSILLNQIKNEILSKNEIDESHVISLNFEDVAYDNLRSFQKLNAFLVQKIKDEKKYYIFLDEIQHVRQFEKVLSSLKATQNVSIFVTGSNSKLLSGRLATLLVGRCKEFKIMPFTYSEFVEFHRQNGIELPTKPLQNYLRYGGMPQRINYSEEEDIKGYLESVFYGIIDKDICNATSKIKRETFLTLSKYIIENVGKEFSPESVAASYNQANANETIYKENIYRCLEKLEQACLISRVKRYDVPSKRTLKKIEKQYVVDNGLTLACSDSNRIFASRALENAIYNELIVRGYEVKIGKTYKGEIDFVVMKNGKKSFIQVAYLLSDETVLEREFSAFSSLKDSSPKFVLSLDDFDMSHDGITHLNAEDFLLGKAEIYLN